MFGEIYSTYILYVLLFVPCRPGWLLSAAFQWERQSQIHLHLTPSARVCFILNGILLVEQALSQWSLPATPASGHSGSPPQSEVGWERVQPREPLCVICVPEQAACSEVMSGSVL